MRKILVVMFFLNCLNSFGQVATGSNGEVLPVAWQDQYIGKNTFDASQLSNISRSVSMQDDNTYQQIGNFKVRGNQNLYWRPLKSAVYNLGNTAADSMVITYDTYMHKIQQHNESGVPAFELIRVDSFTAYVKEMNTQVVFINAMHLDPSKKFFLQKIAEVHDNIIFKKYFSQLSIVSENYINSELRFFELKTEYYFYSKTDKKLVSLPATYRGIKKALYEHVEVETVISKADFDGDLETGLIKIFTNYK